MSRRSAVNAFALAVAFALGMMVSNRPATVSAQPAGGRGKCIGHSMHGILLFRAFEDGTIEAADVGNGLPGKRWEKVGQ